MGVKAIQSERAAVEVENRIMFGLCPPTENFEKVFRLMIFLAGVLISRQELRIRKFLMMAVQAASRNCKSDSVPGFEMLPALPTRFQTRRIDFRLTFAGNNFFVGTAME